MVRQAVSAALAQTRPPDEVVVSDDASPDDTYATLCDMASREPRLRVIRQESNSGGVPNWNHVVQASSGDFIVWCSDDDRLLPDHIEASVGYMEEHPLVEMVHSGFLNVNEEGESDVGSGYMPDLAGAERNPLKFGVPTPLVRREIVSYFLRFYNWPFHPSTLVLRRTFWERVGPFNPDFALSDTEWFVRAAMQGTIVYLPRYSVVNRRHTGNWSNCVGSLKMQREVFQVIAKVIEGMRGEVPEFKRMLLRAVWKWHYQFILARVYVSRSRAGMFDVAGDTAEEMIRRSALARHTWANGGARMLLRAVSRMLRRAQLMIPGGREKYSNLGKFLPK